MNASGWPDLLEHACHSADVVDVVNDFLSQWTPEENERVPADCRVASITDAKQVSTHAFKLAHRLTGTALTEPAMYRLSAFFTKAALRIFSLEEQERDQVRPPHAERRAGP